MRVKKTLKVIGFIFLGIILILTGLVSFVYYLYQGKYQIDSEKHAHNVGYIDPGNTIQVNDDFLLCGRGNLIGYYHSAAPKIYRGGKNTFRNFIRASYHNNDYQDFGYLNLRFHINCNGQVGNLEVSELDIDLRKSDLSSELVDQIIALSVKSENWEVFAGEDYNYYMYLNFKIENGEIAEILP